MATYWALRLGLDKGTSITISGDHLHLIQFIPGVLKEFIEFEKVRKLLIQKHQFNDENFIALSEFIQSDTSIELLDMSAIQLNDTAGSRIIQALKTNITLTDFFADSTQINATIADEIQINLNHNINISEARQYLRNHRLVSTYNLPLPTVFTSGDKLITSMLKNGQSLGATKLAVDKLLTDMILSSKE